jgi:hypothetical protein
MNKATLAFLIVATSLLPASLRACDDCGCGNGCHEPPFHFIDGHPSNGPVTGDPAYADPAHYPCTFGFRDYGTPHPPPVAYVPKPNS